MSDVKMAESSLVDKSDELKENGDLLLRGEILQTPLQDEMTVALGLVPPQSDVMEEHLVFVDELTPVVKEAVLPPPPPPPSTPVQQKIDKQSLAIYDDAEATLKFKHAKAWVDLCVPPTPPPLPTHMLYHGNIQLTALELKKALEVAIDKIDTIKKRKQAGILTEEVLEKRGYPNTVLLEVPEELINIAGNLPPSSPVHGQINMVVNISSAEDLKIVDNSLKHAVLVKSQREILSSQSETDSESIKALKRNPETCLTTLDTEGQSTSESIKSAVVQTLKETAPHLQTMYASVVQNQGEVKTKTSVPVSRDLERISENVPSLKDEEESSKQNNNFFKISKSNPSLGVSIVAKIEKSKSSHASFNTKIRYARANLLKIRDNMLSRFNNRAQSQSPNTPNIISCDVVELNARLRRLNIWRHLDQDASYGMESGRNNSYFKVWRNDMMPTFSKRKTGNETYEISHPEPKDTATNKQRRIGSGRLQQAKFIGLTSSHQLIGERETKKPEENVGNSKLLEFLENGRTSSGDLQASEPANPMNLKPPYENVDEINANSTYVKRVKSGFLVVSNPKKRDAEEKSQLCYKRHPEEPEWFSCGPTSRLDTIELCGFDESEDPYLPERCGKGDECLIDDETKENRQQDANKSFGGSKQSLSQQHNYIGGSYHYRNGGDDNNRAHNNYYAQNGSSRFLPFFVGGKNMGTNVKLDKTGSSTSLNEFFKQALNVQNQIPEEKQEQQNKPQPQQKIVFGTKVNIAEIPSVDELEAKWRNSSLLNSYKHDANNNNSSSNNNINCNPENFKRVMGQLNNATKSNVAPKNEPQIIPDLFNSENLSNFIFNKQNYQYYQQQQKQQQQQHQKQQQQLLQQQQQQQAAIVASFQLHTIVSRPEAQVLLLGLAKGTISKQGLMIQLSNQRLPQREREAINAVLTFTSIQQQQQQQNFEMFSSNILVNQIQNLQNLAIVQQTLAVQQQKQQQQLQLQGNTRTQVTPVQPISQEELQTHANIIMQNALIKRKLEEQTNLIGMQKILQLNAVAAAAAAVKHQQQQQPRSCTLPPNTQNSSPNAGGGGRRLQALQNLFNDSNGMPDSVASSNNVQQSPEQQHFYPHGNRCHRNGVFMQPHRRRITGMNYSTGYHRQLEQQLHHQVPSNQQNHLYMRANQTLNPTQQTTVVSSVGDECH